MNIEIFRERKRIINSESIERFTMKYIPPEKSEDIEGKIDPPILEIEVVFDLDECSLGYLDFKDVEFRSTTHFRLVLKGKPYSEVCGEGRMEIDGFYIRQFTPLRDNPLEDFIPDKAYIKFIKMF